MQIVGIKMMNQIHRRLWACVHFKVLAFETTDNVSNKTCMGRELLRRDGGAAYKAVLA